ncbi:hypothetical protein FKM82_029857 [Ascaphus truei]
MGSLLHDMLIKMPMKRPFLPHSQQLYRHIYLSCNEPSNMQTHYEALYGLLMMISIELANEEVVVDLIRLVLAVQELALNNEDNLPVYNRCAMYALCAAYLNLISQLTTVPAFCQHIHEVRYGTCSF